MRSPEVWIIWEQWLQCLQASHFEEVCNIHVHPQSPTLRADPTMPKNLPMHSVDVFQNDQSRSAGQHTQSDASLSKHFFRGQWKLLEFWKLTNHGEISTPGLQKVVDHWASPLNWTKTLYVDRAMTFQSSAILCLGNVPVLLFSHLQTIPGDSPPRELLPSTYHYPILSNQRLEHHHLR